MAIVLNYIIVNDIISVKPVPLYSVVWTQNELEDLKKPIAKWFRLEEKNKKIKKDNKLNNTMVGEYEVLFTVKNGRGENICP